MRRGCCVICKSINLQTIHSIPSYPIKMWNTNTSIDADVLLDFTHIGCVDCGCVQLQELVDPSILYTETYSTPLFSAIWQRHHAKFARFILDTTSDTTFLEIGGNAGALYKHLRELREIQYTVLDMERNLQLPDHIEFIRGRCEEFEYTDHKTIIASHVFEHLHSPQLFLEAIKKYGVDTVYISIPDFEALLDQGYITLLTTQHTFYCGFEYICYLFSLYGYANETHTRFEDHSTMFKFVKSCIAPLSIPRSQSIISRVEKIFLDYTLRIKSIELNEECYICPAGMYGQMLYYSLSDAKTNVLGFIDGDTKKAGLRLYGTGKLTFSPTIVTKYTVKPITVIVCNTPYENEILKYLNEYSNYITIIYI